MVCEKYKEMIPLSVSGDLESSESKQLAKHLDACASCKAEFERLSEIAKMLSPTDSESLTEIEKLRLENRIYRQLVEKADESHSPRKSLAASKMLLRIAAALLLMITGYSARSIVSKIESPGQSVMKSLKYSPTTTKYRQALVSGLRFSPEGFKVIAVGRSALESVTAHD